LHGSFLIYDKDSICSNFDHWGQNGIMHRVQMYKAFLKKIFFPKPQILFFFSHVRCMYLKDNLFQKKKKMGGGLLWVKWTQFTRLNAIYSHNLSVKS
jgi:hypothetical protein